MDDYNPWEIEDRWRRSWAERGIYRTPEPREDQPTFYILEFFPYPSGAGLSVGHGRNYVPMDVIARYHRMRGDAVLHPMGWDAFGLPAENEAIKQGTHPALSTRQYAANYRRQLELLGCSYDWEREFTSADPAYYRWNQAFFLQLHERGLAYRADAPINWCPSCQTGLANEETEEGTCWRCHTPIEQRWQKQWFIRTTAYAEELDRGLDEIDWPETVRSMQRAWIGRHAGAEIDLPCVGSDDVITIFTTRVDTLFGVTFVALAPEHPLAQSLPIPEQSAEVRAYIQAARLRNSTDRHTRQPDGVATGRCVSLPDGSAVPVFVADYVLAEHGSGAIMGVPAHDTRDFDFATTYRLPVRQVIIPPEGSATALPWTGAGVLVDSGPFSGLPSEPAQEVITAALEAQGKGRRAEIYRLRDWLISRQRYWGTPIPIIHCPSCGEVAVPESDLPVELPPMPDYAPRGDGRSPLSNLPAFVETTCPRCGRAAERETDTMTGFVCSSWYYMRFTDPHNPNAPFAQEHAARWLPVNLYAGGVEHALGHLMYSRFWTRALADMGSLSIREPFPVLRSQGVLHARDRVTGRPERMSKSKGNVVTPESVIERYGADVTRLHLLFMGPFEANVVWDVEEDGVTPQHIEGVRRFIQRVWRLCTEPVEAPATSASPGAERGLRHAVHRAIRDATGTIEALQFNRTVSTLMSFVTVLEEARRCEGATPTFEEARRSLVQLLAPLAPFVTEELWSRWGEEASIHQVAWPTWDPELAQSERVELAVQVNGKVRGRITVKADADEAQVERLAREAVALALDGRRVEKTVVVPGRLVAIVTDP